VESRAEFARRALKILVRRTPLHSQPPPIRRGGAEVAAGVRRDDSGFLGMKPPAPSVSIPETGEDRKAEVTTYESSHARDVS
jgi:hypothetical protein